MERRTAARITECPEYVRVDFGSADCMETTAAYRSFAELWSGKPPRHVLLKAGDNDPAGHTRLRDVLEGMARAAVMRPDFKLALVASTLPVHALYREAQQKLRAAGVNAWVFDTGSEAVEWLEGRLHGGRMTS
jgi:hypothetical protein